MATEVHSSKTGHLTEEKCPPTDDDVCLIKDECNKMYCTFVYVPPQVNCQRPVRTTHKQDYCESSAMQTIYIAEDSTEDYVVKRHQARVRNVEILEEVVVKKEDQYYLCKKQVEVFVFQPSKPEVTKVELRCEAAILRSWQKEEIAERFLPVIRAKPVIDIYQETIACTTVQEYMVIEKADYLLPEYTIDRRTGQLRSLIRRINKLKRHIPEDFVSLAVCKEVNVYEFADTLMPDVMMDRCGKIKGVVRRVNKPKFVTAEECTLVEHGCTLMGQAAKVPSIQFCHAQGEKVSVPYQMSISTGPMFEQALCAAVKELDIKEPFYTQITPSDVGSPDQVTIIPKSVFPNHSAKGKWVLRNPPNYNPTVPAPPKTPNQKLSGFQHYTTYTSAGKPGNLSAPAHDLYQPVTKPNKNCLTVPSNRNTASSFTKFGALDSWRNGQVASEQVNPSNVNTASGKIQNNYLSVLHNNYAVSKARETITPVEPNQSKEKLENELAFYKYMLCGKGSPDINT